MADADPALPHSTTLASERRRRMLLVIGAAVLTGLLLYGIWYWLVESRRVGTDNAYVGADVASVTAIVGGVVIGVEASDTQLVRSGQVLVRLEDADAKLALAQAEAALARAERQFAQGRATSASLASQAEARTADVARARAQLVAAEADFERARVNYDRRRKLAPSGAVSGEELTAAETAFASARANLDLARAGVVAATSTQGAAQNQLVANDALLRGTTLTNNPDILVARSRLAQARLDLSRTTVRAPFDGVVTRRSVQLGQRVAPGTVMMLVVPIDSLYVDANFKEGQLAKVKPGQPVTLTSDLHGSGVEYRGKVVGISGGTGSAFALIPAQNATGNWIKVVQRLPVRIALDPAELKAHPLRVGLSMEAEIDISGD